MTSLQRGAPGLSMVGSLLVRGAGALILVLSIVLVLVLDATNAPSVAATAERSGVYPRLAAALPALVARACDVSADSPEGRQLIAGLRPYFTTAYVRRRASQVVQDIEAVLRHGAPSVEFNFDDVRAQVLSLGVALEDDALEPVEFWAAEFRQMIGLLTLAERIQWFLVAVSLALVTRAAWQDRRRAGRSALATLLRDTGVLSALLAAALLWVPGAERPRPPPTRGESASAPRGAEWRPFRDQVLHQERIDLQLRLLVCGASALALGVALSRWRRRDRAQGPQAGEGA